MRINKKTKAILTEMASLLGLELHPDTHYRKRVYLLCFKSDRLFLSAFHADYDTIWSALRSAARLLRPEGF
jgi:hypothetical protein